MSASLFTDHFRKGTHAERDALATASLPKGCKFACSDHGVVDEWTGSAWALWFSPLVDPEIVRDTIGTALVAGTNVTISVDDPGDHITISAATDPEVVRDTIAAALVAGTNVSITPNDAGDTITIAAASGATYTDEQAQDAIAALLAAGSHTGITFTYDDANNKLSATVTGGGGGGGGGSVPGVSSTLPLADQLPVTPNAKDDEFNDATGMSGPGNGLDARWNRRNAAAGVQTFSAAAPGAMVLNPDSGTSQDCGLYEACPSGNFTAKSRMRRRFNSGRQMWGMAILDSSLGGLSMLIDEGGSPGLRGVGAFVQNSAISYFSNSYNTFWSNGVPLFMKMTKTGSVFACTFWTDATSDGSVRSSTLSADMGSGFVPAYIAIGRFWGGGDAFVEYDFVRAS